MKSFTLVALSAFMYFGAASGAELGKRQQTQQQRISQGVQNGSLTPAEAARLEAREAKIHRQVRRHRASDAKLTPAERAKLNAEMDAQSRRIRQQKTDSNRLR